MQWGWFAWLANESEDKRGKFANLCVRHLHIFQNAPCWPLKILLKHCFQFLLELLGTGIIPRRNEKQRLCKIWGDKQGVLWEMCKWRIAHNTLRSPIPPPQRKKCISIVFAFPGIRTTYCNTHEKLKKILMQNFGGKKGVLFDMSNMKMANGWSSVACR